MLHWSDLDQKHKQWHIKISSSNIKFLILKLANALHMTGINLIVLEEGSHSKQSYVFSTARFSSNR